MEIDGAGVETELGPAGSRQRLTSISSSSKRQRGSAGGGSRVAQGAAEPWPSGGRFSFPRETRPLHGASWSRGETHPEANETQNPLLGPCLQQQDNAEKKIYIQKGMCLRVCVDTHSHSQAASTAPTGVCPTPPRTERKETERSGHLCMPPPHLCPRGGAGGVCVSV